MITKKEIPTIFWKKIENNRLNHSINYKRRKKKKKDLIKIKLKKIEKFLNNKKKQCSKCCLFFHPIYLQNHHKKYRWESASEEEYDSQKETLCLSCHLNKHFKKKKPKFLNKKCVNCKEKNIVFLEEHHILGKKNSEEIIIVCKICHNIIRLLLGIEIKQERLHFLIYELKQRKLIKSFPFLKYYLKFTTLSS
jgi:hypothetical protein